MNRACLILLANIAALFRLCAADFQPETLPLGSPAPDFSLTGVDGRTYTLKNFPDAKILVVVFTCNHCPTARSYEERLKQLVTDYEDKGVALAAIMPNDPKSVRLDELGWTDLSDSFEEMKIRASDRAISIFPIFTMATPNQWLAHTARWPRLILLFSTLAANCDTWEPSTTPSACNM